MSEAKIRLGQVTTLETQLNTIYGQANSAYTAANGSQNSSNTVYADANTANTTAKNAYAQANLAYTAANSAQTYGNTLSTSVNSTVATINTNYQAAYAAANTGATNALNAYAQANSAYTTANNALPKAGGTMTGNLIMSAATVNTSIANISTVITGNALSIGTGIGSNSNVTISANGTEYLRLTNTGNVGIGTATPSTILQVQGSLAATTSLAALKLLSLKNSSDGGVGIDFKNSVSDPLASIDALVTSTGAGTDDGILAFSTATNAVNTERMRIDSSGNLGIGTSSPVLRVEITTAGSNVVSGNAISGSTMKGIKLNNSLNGDESVGLWFATNGIHLSGISGQRTNSASDWSTDLRFYTHEAATNDLTYTRERARITSAGFLGLNTTTPAARLSIVGTGSQLQVNSTGQMASFSAYGLAASAEIMIQAANGTGYNATLYFECPGSNSGYLTYTRSGSRLYASSQTDQSGPYIGALQTSWTTNSDVRLKTNIENINYGLASVMLLNPKKYVYKNNTEKLCFGFIAQDVIDIIPEIVDTNEDLEVMMGLKYQEFIPVLVKAIQEQQALIQSLTTRLTAVESR